MPYVWSLGPAAGCRARLARRKKRRFAVASAVVVAALAGTSLASVPAASASSDETVIVTATGLLNAVEAVLGLGGSIVTQFHLIDGVEAVIPTAVEPLLAALPGVIVTPDVSVNVQGTPESTGPHTPSDAFLAQTGATRLASAGDTGQGVTVAVLDTGIDNLPDFSGRLIGGVDLTGGNNPFQDSYGHGTFVAGLIAGNGASSAGQYSGEAPGANLVSIKVAGASGTTDLATLILGLQWAVDHQASDGIRVLNISLGFQTDSPRSSTRWTRRCRRSGTRASRWWSRRATPGRSTAPSSPRATTRWSSRWAPWTTWPQSSVAGDEMTDFSSVGPTVARRLGQA